MHMKLGQKSCKMLMRLYSENCEFSWNGDGVGVWQTSMSRHFTERCCNSAPPTLIFSKLGTIDESPALNTSTDQFQFIVIAPPAENRK